MPKTKRRVLHGNRQCEIILYALALRNIATFKIPIKVRSRCRKHLIGDADAWSVMTAAFRIFYRGTELADYLSSMTVVIDVAARTVILKNIRLAHTVKYLPKKLHDIRVY